MTLNDFEALPISEMAALMNRYMVKHTARNFRSAEMNFTLGQAEKAMESKGVYKFNGLYRTEEEMLNLLEQKRIERDKKELSQENIKQLLVLLEPERYEKLKSLADKYNYVASYILNEDRQLRIKSDSEDDVRPTSFRVYGKTMERWKAFVKNRRGYTATDLLNTALLEFMDRYEI